MNLKKITKALNLLIINPRLFFKYLNYGIKSLSSGWKNFNLKKFSKKFGDIVFEIDIKNFGIDKLYIKQVYFDCYQLNVVNLMKKYLKKGDVFIDVGANIGYFSALGANLVGKNGQVHSFEPAPDTFNSLIKIKKRNPDYDIILNHYALGNKKGKMTMTITLGETSGASSFLEDVIGGQLTRKKVKIRTKRLDNYINENHIQNIALIKIDVEGFEFPVLKGLEKYLKNNSDRPIIICEITPKAYPLLKTSRKNLVAYMQQFGYRPYNINNDKIPVDITKFEEGSDIIFKSLK